jgi:L-asparaginase
MIVIVFTGGTISMSHDADAGGAVPTLRGEDILALAPEVGALADVEIDDWGTRPGPHMTVALMWALRQRIVDHLARPNVDGVVVTHGTDALEESAYLVARSVRSDKPVVFTGAMRTSSELGWDGPANLAAAVRVATSDAARGLGVFVVMADIILDALDVTKSHTHALASFHSPIAGPLGVVDEGEVIFRRVVPAPPVILAPSEPATPVDIVYAFAGADARLLDASRQDGCGVIVAGMGRGNVPPAMADGIQRWMSAGKPVVLTSRAPHGRVGCTYGYAGGARRLADMGVILGGARRPQQARIDLMLALGTGMPDAALRAFFEGT